MGRKRVDRLESQGSDGGKRKKRNWNIEGGKARHGSISALQWQRQKDY